MTDVSVCVALHCRFNEDFVCRFKSVQIDELGQCMYYERAGAPPS